MGVLINAALGALAGVVGSLIGALVGGSRLALPLGILAGLGGYFAGGALAPTPAIAKGKGREAISELEEEERVKKAKKAKKAAAEQRKKEEAAAAKLAAEEEKALRKREAKKAKKAAAAAAPAVVESEPEAEDVDDAPKSKSALKKAKQKAKEAAAKAEAEAAAKAAEAAAKKKAKKEKKAAEKAAGTAADPAGDKAAAAKAAAAAAAAEEEGWETIEPTKPTKSQLARAAQPASNKKATPTPASERLLTEDVIIPVKQHALIIGAKGATLQMLTEGSGATIDMPKRESGSAKIQITGTPSQVASAKNAIQSLVDRGFSNLTHPGILSDDISVDPKDIGLILGANGANLKQIQSETQTKINLPEKGSSSKKVSIVGEKEGVKRAKAALRSLLNDGFSTITHPGWVKLDIDFPIEKIGLLVGPKGQTIKSIQGDTRTRINTPDKASKSNQVSVCGLPADVARAEKQILKLLEPPPPMPDPEEEDLATDDAWGQEHTAQGEDALW